MPEPSISDVVAGKIVLGYQSRRAEHVSTEICARIAGIDPITLEVLLTGHGIATEFRAVVPV